MGKRGPAPEPTKLKVLKGNPGKRALNDREPEPEVGVGDPPGWLPPAAQAHWAEYAPKLERLGVLTAVDRPVFGQLCAVWADWRAAYDQMSQNDRIFVSDSGYTQVSGYVSDEKALRADYLRLAARFGMTASDRTGIKVAEMPKSEDDFLFGTG